MIRMGGLLLHMAMTDATTSEIVEPSADGSITIPRKMSHEIEEALAPMREHLPALADTLTGGETAEHRKARILATQTARVMYARWLYLHDQQADGRPRRSRQCRSKRLRAMRRTLQRIGGQGKATISERLTAEAMGVYG